MTDSRLVTGVGLVVAGALPLGLFVPVAMSTPSVGSPGLTPAVVGVVGAVAGLAGLRRVGRGWLESGPPASRPKLWLAACSALAGSVLGQVIVWLAPDSLVVRLAVGAGGAVAAAGATLVAVGCGFVGWWLTTRGE